MNKSLIGGLAALSLLAAMPAMAQQGQFNAGGPLGTTNEQGRQMPMSDNVRVFGSFRFAESCTYDPDRNLILAMNAGVAEAQEPNDGYISLINPDGTVHTAKWVGATRDGLVLNHPLGSAIRNGIIYAADMTFVRTFDLASGRPLNNFEVDGATGLNGIAVADDGTIYATNTRDPQRVFKITADGQSSVFVEGAPLMAPNGIAIDGDGNVVVVNIGDNAVLTFSPSGELVDTEHAAEGGNDGLVIAEDGTKYVSSVRYGSVSKIAPGDEAEVIATGIPSAASMCYDSKQKQLVIPLNNNNAIAFISLED